MPTLRRTLFALVAALAIPLTAPAADKEAAVREGWKRLGGTWEGVRAVLDGKEVPRPKEKPTATFHDGTYALKEGEKVQEEGAARIDPTTAPRSLDLLPASGPYKGMTLLGIYEVRGDSCRVCLARPGKPRPKAFESKAGSGHELFTFKRVKAGG
jgi:uncharacterized protein (TIGR03067 family)